MAISAKNALNQNTGITNSPTVRSYWNQIDILFRLKWNKLFRGAFEIADCTVMRRGSARWVHEISVKMSSWKKNTEIRLLQPRESTNWQERMQIVPLEQKSNHWTEHGCDEPIYNKVNISKNSSTVNRMANVRYSSIFKWNCMQLQISL